MRVAILADVRAERASGCYDVESLAAALARRDHDVRVMTATPAGAISGDYRVTVIPGMAADAGDELMPMIGEMSSFLVDEFGDEPPDVVLCHGWAYGMAAALAARHRPVATVQAFSRLSGRRAGAGAAPDTARKLETLLARNATRVTAACTDDMQDIIRMGCPRARVSVLPSGIDVDAYLAAPAPRGGARHRVVALVDHLAAPRGVGQLIAALPAVPSAELLVLGAGDPEGAAAQQMIAHAHRSGVGERTRVLSAVDDVDVATWLASADVAVCPSPHDPDTRLTLTAMACGAAVVAVETGGARDAVITEVTGLLVPPGHPQALSRALRSVLTQNVLRQGMGLAGRARARSRYSWDRVALDAEVVFEAATRRAALSA